jgi:hypothetical protein
VRFWEKGGDALVVSRLVDRLGRPEYDVMFYYVPNMETLLEAEAAERAQRESKLRKAGETAF